MKMTRLAIAAMGALLATAACAMAQEAAPAAAPFFGKAMGAGLGAAIALLGAGYGFGKIGSAALESMARQPEVAGSIGSNMITIAALLEGATFFALIVCLLILFFA